MRNGGADMREAVLEHLDGDHGAHDDRDGGDRAKRMAAKQRENDEHGQRDGDEAHVDGDQERTRSAGRAHGKRCIPTHMAKQRCIILKSPRAVQRDEECRHEAERA